MITHTYTVAFHGVQARLIEVQCALSPGLPGFNIVGLPDKTISEAKERIRSAIHALALAMPAKKITVNLSPANLPKEGSHFDLPITLAILAAMNVLPQDEVARIISLGELALDGKLISVTGSLSAAITAAESSCDLLCPKPCGSEAAWVGSVCVIAPKNLLETINHFTGRKPLSPAQPGEIQPPTSVKCLSDVKGQERAKRALEIASAGRHHMIMLGPPGSGKSMLAARAPGLLPPLSPTEALETSMIHSIAGLLTSGGISKTRPFRAPHHSASMVAMVGGGRMAKPGEISLAHNGILFLDEFPEYARQVIETLRQPIETGNVMIARANAHIDYPCKFMLIAAANPCRCGYLSDANLACSRAPQCGKDYLNKISGPMMDRFDLRIEIPALNLADLSKPHSCDSSANVAKRVKSAWDIQQERYKDMPEIKSNTDIEGKFLDETCFLDNAGTKLLHKAADTFNLTARGYHRVLRVSRTIADLEHSKNIHEFHIAEALSYRLINQENI